LASDHRSPGTLPGDHVLRSSQDDDRAINLAGYVQSHSDTDRDGSVDSVRSQPIKYRIERRKK
jgi:hypothetical protein